MSAAAPLRVVLFGTASRTSLHAFEALVGRQHLVATVLPRSRRGSRDLLLRLAGLRLRSPIEAAARRYGIPLIGATEEGNAEVAERLRALRPDLICIAIFPRLIPADVIALAPMGAINLHPSLLPRHRGPLPLFWTYHADDRVAGVTVHHATEAYDSGDLILQERMPLPRGYPVARLAEDTMAHGAVLLKEAVEQLAAGRAPRVAQDGSAATHAPPVAPGTPMVRFEEWDVERTWHFLAGLAPRFREPLTDGEGRPVLYRSVAGYERAPPAGLPGSVESVRGGWKVHCRDGVVFLAEDA